MDWKENKVVGIVAGIILLIAVGFIVSRLIPRPVAPLSEQDRVRLGIPANTPR